MSASAATGLANAAVVPHPQSPFRIPSGMLAVCALLWGWCHEELLFGTLVALAVESSHLLRTRWDFDDVEFHRLADVSGAALVLVAIVQFSDRGMVGIYGVLKWFPLALLPLLLAQMFSTRYMVKLSALFLSVRFALKRGKIRGPGHLDMRAPFLVACLLSATTATGRGVWLVPAETLVLAWFLLHNAPPRYRFTTVLAALVLCIGVAATALAGITVTRKALEPLIMDLVRERLAQWRDPFRSFTALGEVGQLKSSDFIVLRVKASPGVPVPPLLREATFTQFSRNTWLAGDTRFADLSPNADGTRWDLAPAQTPFRVVTVAKRLVRNRGMLAVPAGSFRIEELPVEELQSSRLAALKVVNGPALVEYRARYADGAGLDVSPTPQDLNVPEHLRASLSRFLDASAASDVSDVETIRRVASRFSTEYRYSLDLRRPTDAPYPLIGFLEQTKSGHCEFFATATVLALRMAGIPARYASGYSVQEWSEREQAYVVRRRHSHTWALAWLDGRWVDVDTTPGVWFDQESADPKWWTSAYDFMSYLRYEWSRWRLLRVGDESDNSYLLWALLPLAGFLLFRVLRSRRIRVSLSDRRERKVSTGPAFESAFRRIEAQMAQRGQVRPVWMPHGPWLRALWRQGLLPDGAKVCGRMLDLHYRACFHPFGLDAEQAHELENSVERWIQENASATPT